MKKSFVNLSLAFSFVLLAAFSFAQNSDLLAVAENTKMSVNKGVFGENETVTNVKSTIAELTSYLSENLEIPDYLEGVYNSDVTVVASFWITTEGAIKNIYISRKSDRNFGRLVKKELEKLNKVTPVLENGTAVDKYVSVPVVFTVN